MISNLIPHSIRQILGWASRLAVLVIGAFTLACDSGPPDDLLVSGKALYSQQKEELIIRHFLKDRREGVFLDVGAYHWQQLSTTLYLEEKLGWTGIAVDALENFRGGYDRNRPGTTFLNYIVADTTGGYATLHVGGPISSTDAEWKNQFEQAKDRELETILVPRITLDDLLQAEGITKVDFLSMDIEGGETAALTGFDIRRFAPDLVCIEASWEQRDWLLDYFTAHGYERLDVYDQYDRVNWYFAPSEGPER